MRNANGKSVWWGHSRTPVSLTYQNVCCVYWIYICCWASCQDVLGNKEDCWGLACHWLWLCRFCQRQNSFGKKKIVFWHSDALKCCHWLKQWCLISTHLTKRWIFWAHNMDKLQKIYMSAVWIHFNHYQNDAEVAIYKICFWKTWLRLV